MDISTLSSLANWTPPKEVQTKFGPRFLRTAKPTEALSAAWKHDKEILQAQGISWKKNDRTGEWEIMWWAKLAPEEIAKREQAVIESRATSAEIDLPHPEGMDYMPFQKAGIRYAMNRPGVLIGDEMGLGKTIQAIGIVNVDTSIDSVIIICPKSLKLNWKREIEKWLVRPLTVGITDKNIWPATDIVIVNYDALGKFSAQATAHEWGACIVDEAHLIKNSKTVRSKNVKAIKSRRKIRLTGTPIANRPVELYNIVCDLDPSWANFWNYAKRYCQAHKTRFGWEMGGASNLDELQQKLRETVMVRRLKTEVLTELPRKIRQIIEVEGDPEQTKAIRFEQDFEERSEDRLANLRAAVELSKAESEEAYLQAVANLREASELEFSEMTRLRYQTAMVKVPAVIDHVLGILEDDDSQKVIIAAHHHDVIDSLADGLKDFNPVVLTGETKLVDRQGAVDRFQTDESCRVFIGSITAAGVGITLTRANLVVFAELDWVPGNVTQMEDRAHRIGQTETGLIQHLVIAGSIDARMAQILVEKQKLIDQALDVNHPARKAPVYQPKQAASTHGETVDALAALASKLTEIQKDAALQALRYLAGSDGDRASAKNDVGFNKIDTNIAHDLAARLFLSDKQKALAWKMVQKYHRQLPSSITNALKTA